MPALTLPALRAQLASGDLQPLYLLVGADDAERAAVSNEFLEVVEEGLRAFNVDRLYGAEVKVAALIDAASTLPMMAPRRILVVLEAEKFLQPKRESKAADEAQAMLETFLASPPAHASIVFVAGALDMRRRVAKLLQKEAQIVDCGTIGDVSDAERWLKARLAKDGVAFEPAALRVLAERAGADIGRLRAGLERVQLYAMWQKTITAEDVRESVPAGPEAQEDFGIAKAIWRNDTATALRELGLALDAGAVPVMLMGQLRAAAEKLPGPKLRAGITAVFRTDLALKTSGGDPRVLLERLVVELSGAPGRPAARRGW